MESGDTVRAVSLRRLILSGMELRSAKRTNMRLSVCLGHLLCVREIQVLSPESLFRAMPNFSPCVVVVLEQNLRCVCVLFTPWALALGWETLTYVLH